MSCSSFRAVSLSPKCRSHAYSLRGLSIHECPLSRAWETPGGETSASLSGRTLRPTSRNAIMQRTSFVTGRDGPFLSVGADLNLPTSPQPHSDVLYLLSYLPYLLRFTSVALGASLRAVTRIFRIGRLAEPLLGRVWWPLFGDACAHSRGCEPPFYQSTPTLSNSDEKPTLRSLRVGRPSHDGLL